MHKDALHNGSWEHRDVHNMYVWSVMIGYQSNPPLPPRPSERVVGLAPGAFPETSLLRLEHCLSAEAVPPLSRRRVFSFMLGIAADVRKTRPRAKDPVCLCFGPLPVACGVLLGCAQAAFCHVRGLCPCACSAMLGCLKPAFHSAPCYSSPASCRKHHSYGMMAQRATFEGLLRRNDERPFVLSRAFFAGSQKYGAIWTGDNGATWEHLRVSPQVCECRCSWLPVCTPCRCCLSCVLRCVYAPSMFVCICICVCMRASCVRQPPNPPPSRARVLGI